MRCGRCDTELIPGKRFCHACGAPAPTTCGSCGAAVAPDYSFCPDCGAPLQATAAGAPDPSARAPVAAAGPDPRLRHLPVALADKLRASSGAAGERKRATVLFCDLAGSTAIAETLDPEVYRDVLDRYLALTFDEISRFEGLVNQLAGDGLMALFGAPIAHEDEPERAVRAALGIQEALAGLSATLEDELGFPLEARIGIHTGMVVAGTVGNDLKMDYTAIGDTTNLASRLQALARPGTVLISDATARLVQGRFRLHRLKPFEVRGKTGPIVAHEVRGAADAVTPMDIAEARGLTPFVGRSAELDQLEACFRRLDRGLFQIVEVVGPAGCGKSRLLYELRRLLAPEEPILFEGRCAALTRTTPYGVWEMMLRAFVGAGNADPPDEVRERVRKRVLEPGYVTAEQAPYLARFLGASTPAIAAEPGKTTARRISDAYRAMLVGAASKGRLVVLLEDLQWIDDASREGLREILGDIESQGAMIVVTHRPDYEHEWLVNGAVTQLRLRPLGDEEARDVVRAVAGGVLPDALEERILRRAEGNPFFLEEIARKLLEEGAITRRNGRAEVTGSIEDVRIPATVQEVVAARIDHLRPAAKRVAQVAAILGRQFESEALGSLLAGEPIDVTGELVELERAGILHRKNMASADEYRFGESFTQEVAYDSLLLRERRRLHDLVGELLLARDDRPLASARAQIGRHFGRGSDPQRGIETLLAAGEEAEAIPSYGDAIRLYREAWDLAETALQEAGRSGGNGLKTWALRAALRLSNSTALYGAAHPATEVRAAVRGIELARELGDTDSLARLHASHGMFVMNLARERFGEGLKLMEDGFTIATDAGNEQAAAALMRALAFGNLLDGRFAEAERKIDAAIAELDRLGHRERLSDTYMGARFFRHRMLYESDRLAEAEAYARETRDLAIRANNRTLQSGSEAALATMWLLQARYDEAIECGGRAAELAGEIENVAASRSATAARALARAALGDAVPRPGELDALQKGLLTNGDLAINMDLIIAALSTLGEVDRARRLAEMALERSGGRLREARNHLALAEATGAGRGGDPCVAHRSYLEALSRAEAIGSRSVRARAHLGLARLAASRGEADLTREHAREALSIFDEIGFVHFARQAQGLLAETPPPASTDR